MSISARANVRPALLRALNTFQNAQCKEDRVCFYPASNHHSFEARTVVYAGLPQMPDFATFFTL
jgi:hypothetical protein